MGCRPGKIVLLVTILIVFLFAGNIKVGQAGTYPPGISYSTLLNGIMYFPKTGEFRLTHIQGTFFPGPDTKGYAIISKDGGEELYRLDFKVEQMKSPYYLMDFYRATDLKTGTKLDSPTRTKISDLGKYRIDFFIDDNKFYTFPFELSKIESSDPFAGEGSIFLDGDWSDWGYLYYTDADPGRNLEWKIWLRTKTVEKQKTVKVNVEILKDGKLVAQSYDRSTYNLEQNWVRYAFGFYHPNGSMYSAKDLLAKNGDYTLKMAVDGKPYGVWKFKVENGKLDYTGRTVRNQGDPLTFIEGGKDAWWYKKQ